MRVLLTALLSACSFYLVTTSSSSEPASFDGSVLYPADPCDELPAPARPPDPGHRPEVTVDSGLADHLECSSEFTLLVASGDPLAPLLDDVEAAFAATSRTLPEDTAWMTEDARPMPMGVAIWTESLEMLSKEKFMSLLEQIATQLEGQGHHGTITLMDSVYAPLSDAAKDTQAVVGALSIVGRPDCCAADGTAYAFPKAWNADRQSLVRVADRAVRWCRDGGSQTWLSTDMESAKVDDAQLPGLISLLLERNGGDFEITCADGRTTGRIVDVDQAGHALLADVGTTSGLEAVGDLRRVFIDLHDDLDHASASRTRLSPLSWNWQHEAFWEVEGQTATISTRQTRIDERHHLLDAHGLQMVGPGFDIPALPAHWHVTPLGSGRTMIEDADPARWFTGPVDQDLKVKAHRELGTLVDQTWSPPDTPG